MAAKPVSLIQSPISEPVLAHFFFLYIYQFKAVAKSPNLLIHLQELIYITFVEPFYPFKDSN